MNRLSLRTRILLIAVSLLAVGLLVGGGVVTGALRDYLVGRVDAQLRVTAPVVARLPLETITDLSALPGQKRASVFLGNPYLAYVAADGRVIDERHGLQQPSDVDPRLPKLDESWVAARGGEPFEAGSEHGSGEWRVVAVPFGGSALRLGDVGERLGGAAAPGGAAEPGGAAGAATVVVAASLDDVDATIERLRMICLISGIGLLAGLTAVGWLAIRSGLRPLRRIEETSDAIARGDLSLRVPVLAGPRTEVGRVAAALNAMLARNEAAVAASTESEARMRRFIADASHELRTPLAGISGFVKLYRMGALPASKDVDGAMCRIESETERLIRLVEELLLLAELGDAADGGFPVQLGPTDLRTLAVDALHDVRALDPDRPVTLTGPAGGAPGPAPAMADEARLRQVVTNLVGNAIAHTPAGTPVRIGVGTRDGFAVLEVADDGPGLTAEQAERVFDRFYRADAARSRNGTGGTGLGLAIVRSLVIAHGGRVELDTAPGRGATFRVLLPAAPD